MKAIKRAAGSKALARAAGMLLIALVTVFVAWAAVGAKSRYLHSANISTEAPDVVFIAIDTLRADRLSAFGGDVPTPAIDSLVERGVVFLNNESVAPGTGPSFASIMTSMYPPQHGMTRSTTNLKRFVKPLAQVLWEQGYSTAAFVSCFVLDSRFGFGRGFDVYDDELVTKYESELSEKDSEIAVDRAIDWMGGLDGKKFFLWVHMFDPHSPYRCWNDDFTGGQDLGGNYVGQARELLPDPAGVQLLDRIKECYALEIRHADMQVARLLEALRKNGRFDNTMFVFIADHGEEFAEHGNYIGHVESLHNQVLHVPLVVVFPDRMGAGTKHTGQVSSIDVMPTVLKAVGLETPRSARGRDLAALLKVSGDNAPPAFSMRETAYWFTKGQGFAVLQGGWKLIEFEQAGDMLFNLNDDPEELNDLKSVEEKKYGELKSKLALWKKDVGFRKPGMNRVMKFLSNVKKRLGFKPGTWQRGGDEKKPKMDAETHEKLKELGYIE